ncbi:hypothetical protein BC629DRAFT_1292490, partial [Irpex lacteus]
TALQYVAFVGFTILIWDHMITFSDEVEYIWRGSKGLLTYLFLLNRYLTPLLFIVNLFGTKSAYLSPRSCRRFIRYEGSATVIGINITMLMMLIRVSALYDRRPLIVGFLIICLGFELGVQAWLLTHGVPVLHDSSVHTCTMIFDSSVGVWASSSAFLPLIYDTIILILTMNRTIGAVRLKTAGKISALLLRDGILYYSVIFAITLVLTVMIVSAPPGLQNIAAHLTVAMGSRIMLHLREQGRKRHLLGSISGLDILNSSTTISSTIRLRSLTARPQLPPGVVLQQTTVVHDGQGYLIATDEAGPSKHAHALDCGE